MPRLNLVSPSRSPNTRPWYKFTLMVGMLSEHRFWALRRVQDSKRGVTLSGCARQNLFMGRSWPFLQVFLYCAEKNFIHTWHRSDRQKILPCTSMYRNWSPCLDSPLPFCVAVLPLLRSMHCINLNLRNSHQQIHWLGGFFDRLASIPMISGGVYK